MSKVGAIWLVGMMGAGKSTLGPALARRLRRPFVDTDEAIEREQGRSVAEIFASVGEAAFRTLEADAVRAVPEDAVVALGGGAIAQPGMAAALAARGTVVYLAATPEELLARIGDAESRPLLAGLSEEARREKLAELLSRREAAYASATIRIETGSFDLDALVEELAGQLERLGGLERGERLERPDAVEPGG